MRKIRSKKLYEFLLAAGVLDGPDEVIAAARREYARLYKREWRTRNLRQKEARVTFTVKQFLELQKQAKRVGLKPTTFCHNIILSSIENLPLIPHRELILKAAQLLGMFYMNNRHLLDAPAEQEFLQAEAVLLHYLHNHATNVSQDSHPEKPGSNTQPG
ncbi:hypothetical protein QQ054_04255 [Oscillatoria amoena NRMC-F 0135]|nr:hypothetical protein [Oscillatoria amoena NRMC-F 0135]